jgi:uncharacterized NAD(P)/FAD-binding protein YdhS
MFRRVAIIGGGAAAATLLSELLERQPSQPLHLDWYTGGGTLARGVAYGTGSERHLLNVRAASMSMFAGKPRGFLDFVQRDDPAITGTDFLPRRRYGDYLETEVTRALQQGKAHGHDVHIIPFAVDALVPEHDGVTVIHGEESHRVDAAVLALGALPPQPLGGVSADALASGRYVVDPWHLLATTPIDPPPRKVVVIGLGLTAVDVLLELSARWPQTEFVAISRHGLLPEAHLRSAAAPAGDSAELIDSLRDTPDIGHWLHQLREAIAQEGDWRTVIDSLRPHTPGLWRELSLEQRARFMDTRAGGSTASPARSHAIGGADRRHPATDTDADASRYRSNAQCRSGNPDHRSRHRRASHPPSADTAAAHQRAHHARSAGPGRTGGHGWSTAA